MPFIQRDELGQICSVSLSSQEGYTKCSVEESPELEIYLQQLEEAGEQIAGTDKPLVRVLEDLIDLLIDREVIRFTDFPQVAQGKLMARRQLRAALNPGLDLLDDGEKPII